MCVIIRKLAEELFLFDWYTHLLAHAISENFQLKKKIEILLIFIQNIDCGYTLVWPRQGSSYVYPQST